MATLLDRSMGWLPGLRCWASCLLLACSGTEKGTTEPAESASGGVDAVEAPELPEAPAGVSSGTGRATIGPAGGSIAVDALQLLIPAGALAEEREITVTRHGRGPTPSLDDTYELGPDGLVFVEPVSVILSVGAEAAQVGDAEARAFGYAKPDGSFEALSVASGSRAAGLFIGALRHFSTLATPFVRDVVEQIYPVQGPCSQLSRQFRFDGFASQTNAFCDFKVTLVSERTHNGRRCRTGRFVPNETSITVHLPDWADECPLCSDAWNAFIDGVRAHEQRHVNIGEAGCANMARDLSASDREVCAPRSADPATVEQQLNQLLLNAFNDAAAARNAALEAQQAQYDAETKHGNLELDCSCEEAFRSDEANCGECGRRCRDGEECFEGVCAGPSCGTQTKVIDIACEPSYTICHGGLGVNKACAACKGTQQQTCDGIPLEEPVWACCERCPGDADRSNDDPCTPMPSDDPGTCEEPGPRSC